METRASDLRLDASRLESLLESARLLGSSLDAAEQLRHLARTIMGRLLVTKAVIALGDGDGLHVELSRGVAGVQEGDPFDEVRAAELGLNWIEPIGPAEARLGLLALGRPMRARVDAAERDFLQALLSLAAVSIGTARAHAEVVDANHQLDQRIQELRALIDLVQGLSSTIEPEEVARLLMLTVAGRWAVLRHALVTWKSEQPPIVRLKGIDESATNAWRTALGTSEAPVRCEEFVLFPIRSGEEINGLVALGPRATKQPYTDVDLEFCAGLVAQASVALDNAWHFRDTLYRRQMDKELELAASIQRDLFPKAMPELAATRLAARNRQARQVGGDYYDVLAVGEPSPETPYLVCVADISGKGISASLLMATIQATLRALLASFDSLPSLARRANDLLWASTPDNRYATALFVLYDPPTGACEYVNCGHSEGILLRADGTVKMLKTTGMPIGLFPDRSYESRRFTLASGDRLMLYSDGVTDACTTGGEDFGVERAIACLRAAGTQAPDEIEQHLFDAIDNFAAGAPQFDDITVLILERCQPAS